VGKNDSRNAGGKKNRTALSVRIPMSIDHLQQATKTRIHMTWKSQPHQTAEAYMNMQTHAVCTHLARRNKDDELVSTSSPSAKIASWNLPSTYKASA